MAGAEMAISVIQGLVVAAIQVAQAISDAIDEANDLMSQLPLVEAGLRTAKTALGTFPGVVVSAAAHPTQRSRLLASANSRLGPCRAARQH